MIQDIAPDKIVYIDESGIDAGLVKDRGWGKKGVILASKKSGKYYLRTNIVAGYVNKKAMAPLVFHGSCDTTLFESWVDNF